MSCTEFSRLSRSLSSRLRRFQDWLNSLVLAGLTEENPSNNNNNLMCSVCLSCHCASMKEAEPQAPPKHTGLAGGGDWRVFKADEAYHVLWHRTNNMQRVDRASRHAWLVFPLSLSTCGFCSLKHTSFSNTETFKPQTKPNIEDWVGPNVFRWFFLIVCGVYGLQPQSRDY